MKMLKDYKGNPIEVGQLVKHKDKTKWNVKEINNVSVILECGPSQWSVAHEKFTKEFMRV
jgi:hypothetical protein